MSGVAIPCSVRTMFEPERAWVGAFVEADGSTFMVIRPGCSPTPRVYASQKEVDPIRYTVAGHGSWHHAVLEGGRRLVALDRRPEERRP